MYQKCMYGRTRPHTSASLMQIQATQEPVADLLIRCKLEAAGVRPTRPRLTLARAIFGSGDRHFTAEMLYHETRATYFAPTLGTIYNTLSEFARRGLLREIALYDARVWYDTKTGPHFHFYFEDTDELSDIADHQLPKIEITPPEGTRIAAIDVILRLKKA
jgi:Fur family transcriptional regulator, iron response regulator